MTNTDITLTSTVTEDLPTLFRFQLDPEARRLAAFMGKDSTEEAAYLVKHGRFLADPTIHSRTIWVDGRIAGSIAKFIMEGEAEITYWIDKKYWGKGIATLALKSFLQLEPTRPLKGRVAFDNSGSQRVLEKCGFVRTGTDTGFASERQAEIEEFIYQLS
ncbi:MAG: N-acetyltransferase [Chitinophagaceae bacterium]|nr:MAG: N-acetyltransferase [Chitinophagaceae bacterium]